MRLQKWWTSLLKTRPLSTSKSWQWLSRDLRACGHLPSQLSSHGPPRISSHTHSTPSTEQLAPSLLQIFAETSRSPWGCPISQFKALPQHQGFPGGSEVKASACNAGDLGSIPGSGRSPGEGNGNPLQYSCLENPMGRGGWWATVTGSQSRTRLSDFTFTFSSTSAPPSSPSVTRSAHLTCRSFRCAVQSGSPSGAAGIEEPVLAHACTPSTWT